MAIARIEGSAFAIGQALGRLANPAMHAHCLKSEAWRRLLQWRSHPALVRLMAATQKYFPEYWQELEGLSDGLDMEFADVFLWNCRADLMPESADPYCSVAANRMQSRFILHASEEDLSVPGSACFVEVRPHGKPGFVDMNIFGSLGGQRIAVNRAGVMLSVLANHSPGTDEDADKGESLPAAIVSRALLDTGSLEEAIDIVMQCPHFGNAHYFLASPKEFIMISIDCANGKKTLVPVANKHGRAGSGRWSALLERIPNYPTDDDLIRLFLQQPERQEPRQQQQTRRRDSRPGVLAALKADCRTVACQIITSGGHRSETVIVDVT